MPRRTLTMAQLTWRPNRKKDLGSLDDIEGYRLLELFHGFASELTPADLREPLRDRYASIKAVDPVGHAVIVTIHSGHYGDEGLTVDVNTDEVAHERQRHHSSTTMTRLVLIVPPGASTALFLFEHQGLTVGGRRVFDLFTKSLRHRFPDHYFPDEIVVEEAGWAAQADLKSIAVTAHKFSADISGADGTEIKTVPVGRLTQTFRPEDGATFFSKALWTAIRGRRLSAAHLLGFPLDEVDATIVEVERGQRSKKFVLGRDKSPAVSVLLNEANEVPLVPTEFLRRCGEEARDFYGLLEREWKDRWTTGSWTPEQRAVRVVSLDS